MPGFYPSEQGDEALAQARTQWEQRNRFSSTATVPEALRDGPVERYGSTGGINPSSEQAGARWVDNLLQRPAPSTPMQIASPQQRPQNMRASDGPVAQGYAPAGPQNYAPTGYRPNNYTPSNDRPSGYIPTDGVSGDFSTSHSRSRASGSSLLNSLLPPVGATAGASAGDVRAYQRSVLAPQIIASAQNPQRAMNDVRYSQYIDAGSPYVPAAPAVRSTDAAGRPMLTQDMSPAAQALRDRKDAIIDEAIGRGRTAVEQAGAPKPYSMQFPDGSVVSGILDRAGNFSRNPEPKPEKDPVQMVTIGPRTLARVGGTFFEPETGQRIQDDGFPSVHEWIQMGKPLGERWQAKQDWLASMRGTPGQPAAQPAPADDGLPTLTPEAARARPDIKRFRGSNGQIYNR